MATKFKPRAPQVLMIEHILNHPRCAVWASMGLGKSSATLTAIDILRLSAEVTGKVLICAPLRVAQSTWPDEVEKWEHTKHLRVSVIVGNPEQRRRALAKPADIYTINYENIPWLVEELNRQGEDWPFEMIVGDESTKLKGFRLRQGTKRARELARVAHTSKVKRFIELTGTPSPNGLVDLYGQAWFLDAGKRLGRTFTAFTQRWFQKSWDGWGLDPLPFAQEQIEDRLRDICISINPGDYFDLEEPIKNVIEVDLPPKARRIYDDMEQRMFALIERGTEGGELVEEFDDATGKFYEVEAFGAAARTMKCLQLANGAAYVDENATAWEEVHDLKIKALEEVIEEAAGMPVLCAYHFRSDLDRLRRAFPKGRLLDKKPQTLRDWNAGRIPLLFAHPASAGHGLNLQDGGNILVFFSLNWNLEEHLQIIERIGPMRQLQAGHERPVFIHYITARDTVDQLVKARLEQKRGVQDILMEAMKKRKAGEK